MGKSLNQALNEIWLVQRMTEIANIPGDPSFIPPHRMYLSNSFPSLLEPKPTDGRRSSRSNLPAAEEAKKIAGAV